MRATATTTTNRRRGKGAKNSPPSITASQISIPGAGLIGNYARQSRRPLTSLAFVLPLLAMYELGLIFLGADAVRNGADVWLRQLLDALGFGQYFLLPVLTVSLLLAWHHVSHQPWRVSTSVVLVMFGECAVMALALVALARVPGVVAERFELAAAEAVSENASLVAAAWSASANAPLVGRVLGFAGAGVYEELLFRLLLVPPILLAVGGIVSAPLRRAAVCVVLTSLIFAAAHYLGPRGETFEAFSFWFRFAAGGCFAMLFVYRGFGIAAGTHALYDVFVSLG